MYLGLLVVLVSVWSVSGQQVSYVLPSGSSPLNCPAQPCLTLYQYTQHKGTYFTTGSTFLFLAGSHTLQTTLTLTNISDLTLRGEGKNSQVNIICKNGVTIQCDRIINLTIEKMTFSGSRIMTALNISLSGGVKIFESVFQGHGDNNDSTGRAITIQESSVEILSCVFNGLIVRGDGGAISAMDADIAVSGSKFIRNRANDGGALYVSANADIAISGSNFIGNRAYRGGALHANAYISINGSNFIGNRADSGGALYTYIATVSGSQFIRNQARFGGAIYTINQLVLEEQLGNIFAHNSATDFGGAINCAGCTISVTRNCTLQENIREDVISETDLVGCSTLFHNNTSDRRNGGAIHSNGFISLLLNGTNIVFTDNFAGNHGGAISMSGDLGSSSKFQLSGLNILFKYNRAVKNGGAVILSECHVLMNGINIEFNNNLATDGGALAIVNSEVLITAKSVRFNNNVAVRYGAAVALTLSKHKLFIRYNNIEITGSFANNSQCECGGALYIEAYAHNVQYSIILQDITALDNAGSAVCVNNAYVVFNGTYLISNTGRFGGGIFANDSLINMLGHNSFVKNNAISGGGIYTVGGILLLDGDMVFSHNTADRDGGALYATGTKIGLKTKVNFTSNTAQNGGAMFISVSSLTLKQNTTLTTSHNHASLYGGAIYHEDRPTSYVCDNSNTVISKSHPECFLRLGRYENIHINSNFDSSAGDGSFLYGGLLDRCKLFIDGYYNYNIIPFNFIRDVGILSIESDHHNRAVTSKPYALCFCDSYLCLNAKTVSISRGQKFIVSIKTSAQDGATSARLTALPGINARIHLNQVIQTVNSNCTRLEYNFYSSQDHDELRLTASGSCGDNVIKVTLLPCPHPFIQDNEECACDKRLLEYPNVYCTTDEHNISYVTKKHGTDFWMSVLYDSNRSYEGLILYKTCPPQYCRTQTVAVSLDDLDNQCDDNHGGVLCGQCLANYSLMLGSSKCRHCSHQYLALLLPFAAAGIALVVFLSFLRLTVATGMINSVIFYTNIIQANRNFIFPVNARNVLTVFIAWMNLDLGFETCFYDGMTAYAQTWLQFAFPLYVWILISFIILSSRYSITVSKLIGHNPIAVLATLLLMSYTKLLKIIIEVYSSVMLSYPDNRTVTVWLKDANVPYLQSWHLLLTVVTTLVLVLFFLPYTLLLLLGYKLYRFAGRKYFRWFHKIRPLLESYYAPYKINTRYWTGFLLLVRCILYIIFSFYSLENTNKSLLAIISTFTSLLILLLTLLLCFSHQLYTKLHNNMMEISIYLNLIVISAAILAGVNSPALVYSLVGLVFVAMLGIIVYHFYLLYIVKSQVWQQFKVKVSTFKEKLTHLATETAAEPPVDAVKSSPAPSKVVTHSEIELREPLL